MFDPKTRILIADDILTMRKLIWKVFRELGYTDITEAGNGSLAWDALEKANPPIQLIVSDWNMPVMTGIDFLRKVRADNRFAKIPFIMLTAESEDPQIIEAIKAGVSNYICKPFTPAQLKEKLAAVHKKVSGGA